MHRAAEHAWILCFALACSRSDKSDALTAGAAGDEVSDSADATAGGAAGEQSQPEVDSSPGGGGEGSGGDGEDAAAAVDAQDAVDPALADSADAPEAERGIYHSSLRQTARPLGSTASALGYLEYLPEGYGDGTKRPLLVFVHGITESGDGASELDKLTVRGPPKLIADDKWPDDRPFIVLSMQHRADRECASANEVRDFIAYALGEYEVDPARVYLTGLSCGALASWNYIAAERGSQIAAAVLVAGDGRPAWNVAGCGLGSVAIWAFHSEGDETIDEHGSIDPIGQLALCPMPPAREAKLTLYADATHDSWTRTYDLSAGNDIYGWMLALSR